MSLDEIEKPFSENTLTALFRVELALIDEVYSLRPDYHQSVLYALQLLERVYSLAQVEQQVYTFKDLSIWLCHPELLMAILSTAYSLLDNHTNLDHEAPLYLDINTAYYNIERCTQDLNLTTFLSKLSKAYTAVNYHIHTLLKDARAKVILLVDTETFPTKEFILLLNHHSFFEIDWEARVLGKKSSATNPGLVIGMSSNCKMIFAGTLTIDFSDQVTVEINFGDPLLGNKSDTPSNFTFIRNL